MFFLNSGLQDCKWMYVLTPTQMWFSWKCTGLHYTTMRSSFIDWIWKAILHLPHEGFFSVPHDFNTLRKKWFLNHIENVSNSFYDVKLFRRTICKLRKSSSTLTRMHILARLNVQSWVLKQVWPAVGSIWALICNSRLHPGVHLWDEGRAPSHIDLPEFLSPRRWGEGRRTRWRH